MNYTELVTAVSDYCENNFPTADMNIMIKQAEQRIYNTVQLANLRKNVTGVTVANNKYLSLPDDFLSVYSIAVYPSGGGEYLYLRGISKPNRHRQAKALCFVWAEQLRCERVDCNSWADAGCDLRG